MKNLPIRRNQFDLPNFAAWLARHGAEVRVPTNEYEVVRYLAYESDTSLNAGLRGKRAVTNIVYTKENGLLTWTGSSRTHYAQFLSGAALWSPNDFPIAAKKLHAPLIGNKANVASSSRYSKRRTALMQRDGEGCWLCGKLMGKDCTIEHLVPRSKGGGDTLENCALAHKACNEALDDKSLAEKIEMRGQVRALESVD